MNFLDKINEASKLFDRIRLWKVVQVRKLF